LGLFLLFVRRVKVRAYGGYLRVALSVVLESIFSMLTAPALMLYQSKFVVAILLRRSVGWPSQNRGDHRLSFGEAVLAHGGQTLTGLLAGYLSYTYIPNFFWWFIPVLAGLILVIPVSIVSSSTSLGQLTRRMGLFLTPEEYAPSDVIRYLKENQTRLEKEQESSDDAMAGSVRDPAACSLHLALLPHRPIRKRHRHELKALLYKLIEEGPERLSSQDRRTLISDPETLMRLHNLAWSRQDGNVV
jgi:membrane glycosyltransferase